MACEITQKQIEGMYYMFTKQPLQNRNVNIRNFCDYLEKSIEKYIEKKFVKHIKGYSIKGIYGQGGNGLVLKLCSKSDCFALKLVRTPDNDQDYENIIDEVEIQELFAKFKIAPQIVNPSEIGSTLLLLHDELNPNSKKIHSTEISMLKMESIYMDFTGAILKKKINMSNIDSTLLDIIEIFMIKTFDVGYIHGDLHTGNIAVMKDGKIKLIDFGWARKAIDPVEQFVDFISLIASLNALATQDQEIEIFCERLSYLLMVCSNYLYGTQFLSIDKFTRIGEFATYVYHLTKDTVIGHNYPLNDGGLYKLDANQKKIKDYKIKDLQNNWKYLNTSQTKFDKLIKVIKTVGSEFIHDIVNYNTL